MGQKEQNIEQKSGKIKVNIRGWAKKPSTAYLRYAENALNQGKRNKNLGELGLRTFSQTIW